MSGFSSVGFTPERATQDELKTCLVHTAIDLMTVRLKSSTHSLGSEWEHETSSSPRSRGSPPPGSSRSHGTPKLAAIAFVIVLWGLSTAAIFYLDSLPPRTFPWSMAAATFVLLASIFAMWQLKGHEGVGPIAASFAAGLLAWGWTEMSLYMGFITGPRKHRCEEGCSGMAHFGHAISANLWHEIVVIALAVVIWFMGNETALWCFVMLWLMHLSARLNVFLGVRNVSAEFVPPHMDVLKGFLRRRDMNPLFPVSCLLLAGLIFWLVIQPQTFSLTLAATLAAIGLLEHILLMLPFPIERLWHWSLADGGPARQRHDKASTHHSDSVHQRTVPGTLS